MHAGSVAMPARDFPGTMRITHVEDPETATQASAPRRRRVHDLVVHDHESVRDLNLVRVEARGHVELRNQGRAPGIAQVDDRRAARSGHMPDIANAAIHHDLAATTTIEPGDLANAFANRHAYSI